MYLFDYFVGQFEEQIQENSVGIKKELLSCITHTAEHNYISPSSTVGIQIHYLLYSN